MCHLLQFEMVYHNRKLDGQVSTFHNSIYSYVDQSVCLFFLQRRVGKYRNLIL